MQSRQPFPALPVQGVDLRHGPQKLLLGQVPVHAHPVPQEHGAGTGRPVPHGRLAVDGTVGEFKT